MPSRVDAALSGRVLQVDAESRPCDVCEEIEQRRATHAVVVDAGRCLGIVSLPVVLEVARERTFAELLPARAPQAFSPELPLADAARFLADSDFDAAPVVDEHGAHVGVVTRQSLLALLSHLAADRAESRMVKQALEVSEQCLQQIVNGAPVLLFATDENGVYTLAEGKTVRAFGARPGDAVGKSAFERYRDYPTITESIRRALAGEEFTAVAEIRGRTYECRCTPIAGANGKVSGMIGLAIDVTERRQAERQSRRLLDELARMGRISTMGEMASGLAHELNQPLAAIVAYVDACQELVESRRMDTLQLGEVLRSVSSQAERAGQIIHRLRKMIKRSQPVRAPMNVNDAVREVAVLIEAEARQSGVTMHEDLEANLPETEADFLQIQKVVLYLMQNGIEAMIDAAGDRRELRVATRLTPANEIEVSICDQGAGLASDAAERLFEPFYTTRANGLGLGLSISRTIVEAHRGRIWITPNSTQGVTARFTLPASGGKVPDVAHSDRIHR